MIPVGLLNFINSLVSFKKVKNSTIQGPMGIVKLIISLLALTGCYNKFIDFQNHINSVRECEDSRRMDLQDVWVSGCKEQCDKKTEELFNKYNIDKEGSLRRILNTLGKSNICIRDCLDEAEHHNHFLCENRVNIDKKQKK